MSPKSWVDGQCICGSALRVVVHAAATTVIITTQKTRVANSMSGIQMAVIGSTTHPHAALIKLKSVGKQKPTP
jgi:hypothetical protein